MRLLLKADVGLCLHSAQIGNFTTADGKWSAALQNQATAVEVKPAAKGPAAGPARALGPHRSESDGQGRRGAIHTPKQRGDRRTYQNLGHEPRSRGSAHAPQHGVGPHRLPPGRARIWIPMAKYQRD